jgi:hypothetical protein
MRRPPWIRRSARGLVPSALLLIAFDAPAAPPALSAHLSCESALGPGRVRCTLGAEVPAEQRLAWFDALVVEAPPFARPLRARIAHRGAAEESKVDVALALLATGVGEGWLVVRARAVVCGRGQASAECRPLSKDIRLKLLVGR